MNVYNNHLQTDRVWSEAGSSTRRRELADADLDSIIEVTVVVLRDFDIHTPDWNVHLYEMRDAAGLERLIDAYDMILNYQRGNVT